MRAQDRFIRGTSPSGASEKRWPLRIAAHAAGTCEESARRSRSLSLTALSHSCRFSQPGTPITIFSKS
eukprot:2692958-Rhodomonas_salina.2